MQTLGVIIRAARERLGWSQAQLARQVGVSRAAIGQWEADETAPTRKHAPAVAQALQLPLGVVDPRAPQSVVYLDTSTQARTIPIVGWEGFGMRSLGRNDGLLSVDVDTPSDAVAMRVIDDAMAREPK
jgi:transcriptional regulator with XRE-family HTH domain